MRRRRFLAIASAAVAGSPILQLAVARTPGPPAAAFGLVADAQYADADSAGTRFYRQSLGKLTAAVDRFNRLDLAFCVSLGDLIDHDWRAYDAILGPLARSKHRFHHVLGNHDFEVAANLKPRVPQRLGLRRRYRSLKLGPWCVVLLDTTDVSLYAHPEPTPAHAEAAAAFQALAGTGARNAQTWNGAVGGRQLEWFETTCRSAAKARRRVIVLAHHPVYPEGPHTAWNATRILEALDRQRNVVAWFNGHNHEGAFGLRDGVPFITLKGMVETQDANAYAAVYLHADRLELVGYGREPSREVRVKSPDTAKLPL